MEPLPLLLLPLPQRCSASDKAKLQEQAVSHARLKEVCGPDLLQIEVANKLDSFLEAVRCDAVGHQVDLEVLGQSGCPALG